MSDDRPLEDGWLPDTPVGDTVLRRFLFNQSDVNVALAQASGGRALRRSDVVLADAGGPVPYYNQALLLRPLTNATSEVLDAVEAFYRAAPGRPATLLSLWPTPDLRARGWTLVGHPALVIRGAFPAPAFAADGVTTEIVRTPRQLADLERVVIEGYPLPEANGLPAGAVLPASVLSTDVIFRLGKHDGVPVAAAASCVGHGVVNLCLAATLEGARRRGVWQTLVWNRVADGPDLPAVAYTSDFSRPGFERMGFVPTIRMTLWFRIG